MLYQPFTPVLQWYCWNNDIYIYILLFAHPDCTSVIICDTEKRCWQHAETPVSRSLSLLSVLPSDKGECSVGSLWTLQFNFQNPSVPASHLESAAGEREGGVGRVGTARNTPLMGCFCYRHKIRREDEYGTFIFFFHSGSGSAWLTTPSRGFSMQLRTVSRPASSAWALLGANPYVVFCSKLVKVSASTLDLEGCVAWRECRAALLGGKREKKKSNRA